MLHIILTILKILGIVILALLGLILLLMITVTFVPLRYQLQAVWEKEKRAAIDITWILHMFAVHLAYELGNGIDLQIRIFGIDWKRLLQIFKKLFTRKKKSNAIETDLERSADGVLEISSQDNKVTEETSAEDIIVEETSVKDTIVEETSAEDIITEETSVKDTITEEIINEETISDATLSDDAYVPVAKIEKVNNGRKEKAEHTIFDRCSALLGNMKTLLEKVIGFLLQIPEQIGAIPSHLLNFAEKAGNLLQKPEQIRVLLERLEAQQLLGDIISYLKYLALHYKPRKLKGYLHYGTGDPAMTGWIYGILTIMMPANAKKYNLAPEIYEACFETNTNASGHVRAVHLFFIVIRALLNKRVRKAIKIARKRS